MAETRLSILGSIRLDVFNRSFVFDGTPVARLLGYLALHAANGRAVARTTLASKLWPDLTEQRARRTLNETLYRLRQLLGGEAPWLHADSMALRLIDVWIDAAAFRTYTASPDPADWRIAVDLYNGQLLEGLDADWLLVPRVALHDTYVHLLARLCDTLTERSQLHEALACAHQWVLTDPFNEDARRRVMYLAARLGRHAAALTEYDQLVHLLEEEFQTAPLPETRALANAIRAEYHSTPDDRLALPALVGRRAERATLIECVEQALDGRGGVALVEGQPGIGKTRLLEALAESAAWRGMCVAWGCAQPGASVSAGAPLDTALRAALAGVNLPQLRAQLGPNDDITLQQLAPHAPVRAQECGGAADSHFQPTSREGGWRPDTLAALVRGMSALHPQLLILDNMQWAGAPCWQAIEMCAPLLFDQPVLLVLSYRGEALRGNQLAWRTLRTIDRDLAPQRLLLEALSPHAGRELARAAGVALDPEEAQVLHQHSGGNPQIIRELLALRRDAPPSQALRDLSDERSNELPAPHIACPPHAPYPSSQSGTAQATRPREEHVSGAITHPHRRRAAPPQLIVPLASAQAPLGRPLADDEHVIVRWTVDAGAPDAALLRSAGKVALRHHRIVRLLDEALIQGAAATDQDLARALGVTERTISADIAALRSAGQPLVTRRRKRIEPLMIWSVSPEISG